MEATRFEGKALAARRGTECRGVSRQIELRVLGTFELRIHRLAVQVAPSVERLLAYLALRSGPATRLKLAGVLWTDHPEQRAMANLRSAIWRAGRTPASLLRIQGELVALAPEVSVDLKEAHELARRLRDGASIRASRADLERLESSGEVLADWYDDWVLIEREQFRQLRLQALEQVAARLARECDFGRATDAALAAVGLEPLRESAQRALISVHLAQGNRAEAVRQFDRFRQQLADELDLEPTPSLRELIGSASAPN